MLLQDMDEQDAPRRDAECPRGLDEQQLAHDQRRRAHDPGNAWGVDDGQCEDHVGHRCAQYRDESDRKQDVRERHHRIDQPHDRTVQPAKESGRESEQHTAGHRDKHDHGADHQRIARPENHAREYVAAKLVGAEPMCGARTLQPVEDFERHRVVGRDPRREDRERHDDAEDHRADQDQPAPEQLAQDDRGRAARNSGDGHRRDGGGHFVVRSDQYFTRGSTTRYSRSISRLIST